MPNFMSVVHFILVEFGEGYLLLLLLDTCDGGKTKSTPSPTELDCTVRLDWSLTIKILISTVSGFFNHTCSPLCPRVSISQQFVGKSVINSFMLWN